MQAATSAPPGEGLSLNCDEVRTANIPWFCTRYNDLDQALLDAEW